MRPERRAFHPGLWPSLIVAALLILLVGLGFWQLDRAEQKRVLLEEYEQRPQQAALRLDAAATLEPALRYRQAWARGRYDPAHQFLLDNRVHQGRAGYQVLTPLRLAHSDAAVLVNRGWVPQGRTRADLPPLPVQSEGVITVEGMIDYPPEDPFSLGEGEARAPGWPKVLQQIDFELQSRQLDARLLPVILLLDPAQPDGFVRQWAPIPERFGPARHVGYAVQWFALALALVILFYWAVRRPAEDGADRE